jgi:UDP-GlcNAc:undecaprenyl-phosphate GlcNAc-1-phosphate transferase
MGDSGALLVGLLMAVTAINVTDNIDPSHIATNKIDHSVIIVSYIPILLPLAILLVPLLDFSLAVLRRLQAGRSPFSADRKHLHHRLLDLGHSHLHAVLIFYAWTLVASVGLLSFLFVQWWWALAFLIAGFAVTAGFTLAPLGKRRRAKAMARTATAPTAPASSAATHKVEG